MIRKGLLAVFGLTLVLGLAGCGGGSTTVQPKTETQGRELLDLKEALDKGAITPKEYEKAKAQILKRR